MSEAVAVGIIAGTILVTIVVVKLREQRVQEIYERQKFTRKLLAAIISLLIAWTFINSGNPWLIALAIILIAFATTYYVLERPDEKVI